MSRRWLLSAVLAVTATVLAAVLAPRLRPTTVGPVASNTESRLPAVNDSLFASAAHILIAHKDSEPPVPGVTRTRSEAREKALRLSVLLSSDQAEFSELARKESDDPRAAQSGGYLGVLRRGKIPLEFQVALFGLEPGQIYPALETPAGWHIIQRLPIRLAVARHILITWDGSAITDLRAGRTKNQARLLAEEVLRECGRPDADFCELAARYSDDAGTRFECGDLDVLEPGVADPAFEDELFHLRPGETSQVLVESPFGYHIIQRVE